MHRQLIVGAIILVASAGLVAIGYYVGSRGARPALPEERPPNTPATVQPKTEPLLPLAHVVLPKGEMLRGQNPDAYAATYLDKRYRVVGKVGTITGVGSSGTLYETGPVFRLTLEPWAHDEKFTDLTGPHLEIIDFSKRWSLALRPGDKIDANCVLKDHTLAFNFEYCRLNKL